MDVEPDSSDDAAKRNAVRSSLVEAFESVSVWLLPAPTERTADLRKVRACMLSIPRLSACLE